MTRLAWFSLAVFLCVASVAHAQSQTLVIPFGKVPYVSQPECDALLADSLTVTLTPTSNTTNSVTIATTGGASLYSEAYSYDFTTTPDTVPSFIRTISLQGSRSAPAFIFIELATDAPIFSFRMDFFIDAKAFRSSDPTNANFLENDICMVSFASVVPSQSAKRSVEPSPSHVSRAISTCVFENTTVTFQDARDCIQSVTFSADQRTRTLDSLDILADIYVYRDINIDSPDNEVNIDLVDELDDLRDDSFSTNYDFHNAVRKLFVRGRDLHTTYRLPVCYQSFRFYQPFSLYSTLNDDGDQVLVVASKFDRADTLYNFAPGAFDGYIVDQIDDEDAMDHYIDWVNENVIGKHESRRFNLGLGPGTGRDAFTNRVGIIPENPSVKWELINPITNDRITLVVPWYADTSRTYSSASDFSARCLTENVTFACTGVSTRDEIPQHSLRSVDAGTFVDSIGPTKLYALTAKTAVLVVPTFSPNFLSSFWMAQSFAVLYLESIHRFHFDEIMIDVSNNGGGTIQNGLFLAGLFDKNQDNILDVIAFDQIHSDFFDEAIEVYFDDLTDAQRQLFISVGADFFFNRVENGDDEFPSPRDSWYKPGESHTRGGKKSKYSEKIEINYEFDDFNRDNLNLITSSDFYENYDNGNVLVITNGICHSTCSIFVRSLQQSEDVPLVGYGGIQGDDYLSSDGPANVIPAAIFTALGDAFTSFGFNQFVDLTPRPFPFIETCSGNGHLFQLTFLESYAPGSDTPQEFTDSRVDVRLNIWPRSSAEVWPLAATEFLSNRQSTYLDIIPSIPSVPSIPSIPDLLSPSSSASVIGISLFSIVASLLFLLF